VTFDLDAARQVFEASSDFTIGIEEEFALLDPETLSLTSAFDRLEEAARYDDVLADSLVGELISSEVEIRSGRQPDFGEAVLRQQERRDRLFELASAEGVVLGATGAHPWSPWKDQRIIDTPHYQRVEEGLKYVAWRNNTFSLHVHVGVHGPDRAVAVCDRLRPTLPTLLAVSANSAWVEGRFSGLHSARTQMFTKSFPRCGIPDHFGSWRAYEEYVAFLLETRSIVESTQLWWSVRPHLTFGTVEVRIMDAQSRAEESTALAALALAAVAQAAIDYDEQVPFEALPRRLIEENLWRAIRYGLDGSQIDLHARAEQPAPAAVERLLDRTQGAREALALDRHLGGLHAALAGGNGAQRQWRREEAGVPMRDAFAEAVDETCRSYTAAPVASCEGVRS
jgi:carboxylate-amine ligase